MSRTSFCKRSGERSVTWRYAAILLGLLGLQLMQGLAWAQSAAGGPGVKDELRLSVAPYLAPARMEELYTPMAVALSEAMGRPVVFRTTSTFDRYYEQIVSGSFDITLLHAFFYVAAVDQHSFLPIARMREPFTGMLVVPSQSAIKSLEDLRGKIIATPPEYLPTVHLVRRLMRERGFDPEQQFVMKSFRSVESCLQQIVIDEAAACICPPFALPGAEKRLNVKFRTIVESQAVPNLTFVAHARMSSSEQARLREAVINWSSTDAGRKLMQSIGTSGFVVAKDAEYDNVRRLMKSLDKSWLPSASTP